MGQRTGDSICESPVVAGEMWYAARESNPQPTVGEHIICTQRARCYSSVLNMCADVLEESAVTPPSPLVHSRDLPLLSGSFPGHGGRWTSWPAHHLASALALVIHENHESIL